MVDDCIHPDCECLDYCEAIDPWTKTPTRKTTMGIQVTISDTRNVTLNDLLELVPKSKAAEEVGQMRTALKDIAEWTERWTSGDHSIGNIARRALGEP